MKFPEKQLCTLWRKVGFEPDPNQKRAILHVNGPLYLPAGPGSGKTRVLLWRALNLILFHQVKPDQIFLATFTEKAASKLRDGLRGLLGLATANSSSSFDISGMYVGTVHSLCLRLMEDRRFSPNGIRQQPPSLLDELAQLLYIYKTSQWNHLVAAAGLQPEVKGSVNKIFGLNSNSRFEAAANCIRFFNRLSEECVDPEKLRHKTRDKECRMLLDLYTAYLSLLREQTSPPMTDFSLLQQDAFKVIDRMPSSKSVFRHIIIDEYQDTNSIQERLFFKLAEGQKNLCVVGDDDQSLYRFRGATVQNFVEFPARCERRLKQQPTIIPLGTNYRSRRQIVEFFTNFMTHCDWKKPGRPNAFYRVVDKNITAKSLDRGAGVVASKAGGPEEVCSEIASLARALINNRKVTDPNQIAFLFPSLNSPYVERFINALQDEGLKVYAPRAGRFLETEEALTIFGIYLQIFDRPERASGGRGREYHAFHDWIDVAWRKGADLLKDDALLRKYVAYCRAEIETVNCDYNLFIQATSQRGWKLQHSCESPMRSELLRVPGLSTRARSGLQSKGLDRLLELRKKEGRPLSLQYLLNRATSLDWNVLDLFYRLCGFQEVKAYIDVAENGKDEGPVCNLALISQYLARYQEEYNSVLTGEHWRKAGLRTHFSAAICMFSFDAEIPNSRMSKTHFLAVVFRS